MTRIRTLSPEDVQHLQSALRIAIRTERTYLQHERPHLPPGAAQTIAERIAAFQTLADGLSSSAPPELPTPELPTPELPTPELPTPELPTPELPMEDAMEDAKQT